MPGAIVGRKGFRESFGDTLGKNTRCVVSRRTAGEDWDFEWLKGMDVCAGKGVIDGWGEG